MKRQIIKKDAFGREYKDQIWPEVEKKIQDNIKIKKNINLRIFFNENKETK